MAITRLKRKGRRNKQTAAIRRSSIKQLTSKPVIKNVDVEEIKEGFKASSAKAKPKKETPKAEVAVEAKEEVTVKKPVAKKAAPKKAAPKKAAPKKEA